MNQTLIKAAELLARTSAFSKGAFAYDKAGNPAPPKSKHACSWCMIGAIHKVSSNRQEGRTACGILVQLLGKPISQYNDNQRTTQASAVRKLRQAARTAT